MSCGPQDTKFRLLDSYVGWDVDVAKNIVGFDDPMGIRLKGIGKDGLALSDIDPYIPPPRLAPGCGPCEWVLGTKAPPLPSEILRLTGCDHEWRDLWSETCRPLSGMDVAAVAIDRHRLAIAERSDQIWIAGLYGGQILGGLSIPDPVDLAFTPNCGILIAGDGGSSLVHTDLDGQHLEFWPAPLPLGKIERLAYDQYGRLWLVMRDGANGLSLWRSGKKDPAWVPATLADLTAAFEKTSLVRADENGFCLKRGNVGGGTQFYCYSWYGRPIAKECVSGAGAETYEKQGQLLTLAIDSGTPRCRWHRIRLYADIPDGAGVEVALATSENANPMAQGLNKPPWLGFGAGIPHPDDWQLLPKSSDDGLVQQPAGRYLFLRIRLTGDGTTTPVIRRIHLDFPRSTSADLLPYIFREEPESSDFTERFLSLFDATLENVDTATRGFSALLDARSVPEEVLNWIADLLGIVLDPDWDAECRRRILKAAPELFRRRGTRGGLIKAIDLTFNTDPAIREHGAERNWGAIAAEGQPPSPVAARLNQTRLFSRGRARMTIGTSPLGFARILSVGNPDDDPHLAGAFRFSVGIPAGIDIPIDALTRILESQKPAHTQATIRLGDDHGFVLGPDLQLGVDTLINTPPPAVLREKGTALNRQSILATRRPPSGGRLLAQSFTVTNPTSME